jgi:hypothetical protein
LPNPALLLVCSAVANLAVALLSLEESEGRLLDFLSRARTPLRKPLFDPKYALRLAKERNRCADVYCVQHCKYSSAWGCAGFDWLLSVHSVNLQHTVPEAWHCC